MAPDGITIHTFLPGPPIFRQRFLIAVPAHLDVFHNSVGKTHIFCSAAFFITTAFIHEFAWVLGTNACN
jgi:hypothetical protein